MQGVKCRTGKYGTENAGLENAGPETVFVAESLSELCVLAASKRTWNTPVSCMRLLVFIY